MKANLKWLSFLCLFGLTNVSLMVKTTPVTAQTRVNLNSLNGLFTPTQSQRFSRAGRERFEREIKIFSNPDKYFNNDLLTIDTAAIEQMKTPHPSSIFNSDPLQYELSPNKIN